jgi:hypothetical protein
MTDTCHICEYIERWQATNERENIGFVCDVELSKLTLLPGSPHLHRRGLSGFFIAVNQPDKRALLRKCQCNGLTDARASACY